MKGGKREGAGRPKAEPTTVIRVRLTKPQHAEYVERGAEHWLKRVLDAPEQPAKEQTT